MGRHDATYATLYSHPFLVESLLRGFLPEHWTERFDFQTLELEALGELPRLLPDPEHEALQADVVRWILELILPSRLEGVNFPQVTRLEEVVEMITANAPDWTARWRNEGRREGREEGRMQGREEGRLQGRDEGRRQGREEGRRQGEAELLMRLLTRRFGPLDRSQRRRLETADAEQLLEWGERFVTARSLGEVFNGSRSRSAGGSERASGKGL